MKLDFTTYTDEKLRLWVLTWEYCSQVKILYDIEVYNEAIKEATKRDLIFN